MAKKLGDLLLELGLISEKDLELAVSLQSKTDKKLGQILLEQGLLSEDNLVDTMAMLDGLERVKLEDFEFNSDIVTMVTKSMCIDNEFIPLSVENNVMKIATTDPFNYIGIRDIELRCGVKVKALYATKKDIFAGLAKVYGNDSALVDINNYAEKMKLDIEADSKNDISGTDSGPVVQFLEALLEAAFNMGSSDIHIEPTKTALVVRLRVDGVLREHCSVDLELHGELINRIKIMSDINIFEKRLPQDGRFSKKTSVVDLDIRVSTLPTIYGEKCVLRLLDKHLNIPRLIDLGISERNRDIVSKVITRPYGLIVACGPTGSGKSTTLASLLNNVKSVEKNTITIEDPPEYLIEGINQVAVNSTIGLTFAKGLRSILRQDPDIVMIGEVRDAETANIAVSAALTGHLVLTTIHTNDAVGAIARFLDMGVEPYLLADALICSIGQRLVRKLCPYCGRAINTDDVSSMILGVKESIEIKEAVGCPKCNNSGYQGREGCYELFDVDSSIRTFIAKGSSDIEIREYLKKKGTKSIRDNCIEKIRAGVTDIRELHRISIE